MANFSSDDEVSTEERAKQLVPDVDVTEWYKWHLAKKFKQKSAEPSAAAANFVESYTHIKQDIIAYEVMKISSISLLRTLNEMREKERKRKYSIVIL